MPVCPVRVAVEGCGHGTLHAIYASIEQASKEKGWDEGPDLVIIGGDMQATRNANDLTAMSVPQKYREIGDFHEYYSGQRVAPYLTIFVGGNHEASNHLFELYYGGWAAPNIYYLGAANVIRFGPLRIAGLSGIWKGYNYRKPHYERLPYSQDDVKSIYHVRELDVRKLLQLQTQVDIGISHDWPKGVEWLGEWKQLFRFKPHFEEDAKTGRLGSPAARYVLDWLRPTYWFSAHLHCKYSAIVGHPPPGSGQDDSNGTTSDQVKAKNEDEIDIDLDEGGSDGQASEEASKGRSNGVSDELRALLPDSFSKPTQQKVPVVEVPEKIKNRSTHFLALDKCLPRRRFLQLVEIEPVEADPTPAEMGNFTLSYDPEWLAITRAFESDLVLGDRNSQVPPARDYRPDILAAEEWIQENVVQKGLLPVPGNFEPTAPFYNAELGINSAETPEEYTSPQTVAFCALVGIENKFDISEEERQERTDRFRDSGESLEETSDQRQGTAGRGGYRGGRRGGGRGRRHTRGQWNARNR